MLEDQKKEERQLLDDRSQPIRQYLSDNVISYLTDGLLEISKNLIENPLLALVKLSPIMSSELLLRGLHLSFFFDKSALFQK